MLTKPDLSKPIFALFSPSFKASVEQGLCPFCSRTVVESQFPDELSKQEYSISGLCYSCQDNVFNQPKRNTEYEKSLENM